jgi:Flp pilus assembly protein TadB
MKFISLFTKTPNHKRFNYTPRYWDQAAEERKEREERIRRELEREQGLNPSSDPDYRSRIAGSFHSARRRSNKSSGELNAVLLRSGVLLFLVLFLMAFLTWGTDSLYALLIFIPVYFYFKFKK